MTSTPTPSDAWWSRLGASLLDNPAMWMEGLLAYAGPVNTTHACLIEEGSPHQSLWTYAVRKAWGDHEEKWTWLDTTLSLLQAPPAQVRVPGLDWLTTPENTRYRSTSGRSPLHLRLDASWNGLSGEPRSQHHREPTAVLAWMSAVPPSALMDWFPIDRYSSEPDRNVGSPILTLALRQRMSDDVMKSLLKHGARWHAAHKGLQPAQAIHTPEQWQFFLAHGGNPDAPCMGRNDKMQPLWQWLLEQSKMPEDAWLKDWAKRERSQAHNQEALNKYWERLEHGGTLERIMEKLRSHEDWATLVNPKGIPAVWLAASLHGSVWDKLPKKALGVLEHQSPGGPGVLAWALANCASVPWKTLMERSARRDSEGRGILAQACLLGIDQKSFSGDWEIILSGLDKATSAPVEDLWALPDHSVNAVIDSIRKIYWGSLQKMGNRGYFSPSKVAENLSTLSDLVHQKQQELPPVWHALLALASSSNRNASLTKRMACMEYHLARATWPSGMDFGKDAQEMLESDCDQAKAGWEGLQLRLLLPEAEGKPRARVRL